MVAPLLVAATVLKIAGGLSKLRSINDADAFNNDVRDRNRKLLKLQLGDIKRRAELNISRLGIAKRTVQGAQRAAAAGQGVSVDVGTPADLQESAEIRALAAERSILFNASLAAFGVKNELENLNISEDLAGLKKKAAEAETIFDTATSVASVFA